MRRPARRPPACFSVRPGKRITIFSPSCLKRSRWPSLKPSPMATISTIEATPHAIPAIVRKLRSLLRNNAETTWVKSSRRKSSMPPLLKNDMLPFVETAHDLGPRAVADAGRYRHPPPSAPAPGVRYLHLDPAILSVNDRAFGNRQHALALFQQDLGVGRHGGHQLARFIGAGNPHFEGGDVVLLHAHGRYLGGLAGEFLVLIGFHRDARPLPQKDFADVALVHLAFDVDLAQVAYRHDQRGATAHGENGADRIARIAVARQHHAGDRRHNGGVAQVFFRSGKLRARLFHLRFGLANRRLRHAQIDHRLLLAVLPQFVILLRFVARHRRGHLLREHLAHPLHIALQKRDIRALGLHFGSLVLGLRALQRRVRPAERRLRLPHPRQQIVLVQLADHLPLPYAVAHIHRQLQDDTGSLGFDLDFGGGLYLPGGHHRARQVHARHLHQLFGVDLRRRPAWPYHALIIAILDEPGPGFVPL